MSYEKEILTLAIGVVLGVVGDRVFLHFWNKRKAKMEPTSQWDMYMEARNRYASVQMPEYDDPAAFVEEELESVMPIPMEYKVVRDEKPDLMEAVEELKKGWEETPVEEQEGGEVDEDEVIVTDIRKVEFDGSAPVFSKEDWDSESASNILMITKSEYLNLFQHHQKEQAVWFDKSKVLVDGSLNPIDVVDTVGPTAFTQLMKDPHMTIFVQNEELATDYELFANPNVTIEEAWEESGR